MSKSEIENNENNEVSYFNFREVLGYFFRKNNPDKKYNINIRMMHGINRIAMSIFLLAVIFMIIRAILRTI